MDNEQKDKNYIKLVLDSMLQLIEEKLQACKTGLPLILTITTSLIAFFFMEKYETENVLWLAILATVYLLVSFVALLLTSFPKVIYKEVKQRSNKKTNKKRNTKTPEFNPSNVKSYFCLTSQQFDEKLQKYLGGELNLEQKLQVSLLKSKINEYRYKRELLKFAYGVLIAGAFALIFVFTLGLLVI